MSTKRKTETETPVAELTPIQRKRVEAWVAALRSGKYKQTRLTLRRKKPDGDGFCCLGVGCELYRRRTRKGRWDTPSPKSQCLGFNTKDEDYTVSMPRSVLDYFGISDLYQGMLATLNDKDMCTFLEIANWLERRVLCKK